MANIIDRIRHSFAEELASGQFFGCNWRSLDGVSVIPMESGGEWRSTLDYWCTVTVDGHEFACVGMRFGEIPAALRTRCFCRSCTACPFDSPPLGCEWWPAEIER